MSGRNRRRFTPEFKADIVAQCCAASISYFAQGAPHAVEGDNEAPVRPALGFRRANALPGALIEHEPPSPGARVQERRRDLGEGRPAGQ